MKLPDSVLLPDLAVVAGTATDYLRTHPATALLVIEIAITTLGLDREKASLYAEAGVAEYWIVATGKKTVEVYTEPFDGQYAQRRDYAPGETIVCAVLPKLQVETNSLFIE